MWNARQIAAAGCLCTTAVTLAHDHWIVAETPAPGEARTVLRICSGHGFPESDVRLAERLLANAVLVRPDGNVIPLRPAAQGKAWVSAVPLDEPGVWTASFVLQRPQTDKPFHRARCLIVVGERDDPDRYATGEGLEIVPGAALSRLTPGDVLPLSIRRDGSPVPGTISVIPEKGRASFLSASETRPAQLRISRPGAWLLTVSHEGTSFALTFAVAPQIPAGAP